MAQTLTAVRHRQRQKALSPNDGDEGLLSIEIQDLDKKVPWPEDDYMTPLSKRGPPPFDFERLTRFMAYGFMMAPIQHKWFGFLSRIFPIGEGKGTSNALRRVAFDQFLFAPVGMLSRKEFVWDRLQANSGLRSRGILHVHDSRRGWWQACRHAQVPGRVSTSAQGKLHSMAACPSAELSRYTDTVSDRKCGPPH